MVDAHGFVVDSQGFVVDAHGFVVESQGLVVEGECMPILLVRPWRSHLENAKTA